LDTSGSKYIASCLGCFTPGKTGPSTHWIGCQMGSKISQDASEKSKTNYVSSHCVSCPFQVISHCISCTFQELYLKKLFHTFHFLKKRYIQKEYYWHKILQQLIFQLWSQWHGQPCLINAFLQELHRWKLTSEREREKTVDRYHSNQKH